MATTPAPHVYPPVFSSNALEQVFPHSDLTYAHESDKQHHSTSPSHVLIRYKNIKNKFNSVYGSQPEFYARAPGRVNLIGEHIDYNGYPVLPFALEQDVVIAVHAEPASAALRMHNMDDTKFPPREVDVNNFTVDGSKHDWSNYFLAAHKGITEHCKIEKPTGLSVVVHGTVLMGAGLSSSSAYVCASALAIARAYELNLTKTELANITQRCERYIGMEGGGMDQAISFLAQSGTAKLIEFNPLTTHDVSLPGGATFVICNSLVESTKYLTAGTNYNMRVLECKLATAILAKSMGLEWQTIKKPCELEAASKKSLAILQEEAKKVLKDVCTKEEAAQILGLEIPQLEAEYFTSRVKVVGTQFKLLSRLLHVYAEADRVYRFRDICGKPAYDEQLKDLGKLMNESHFSCSRDYECSCPELDDLTAICRKGGALGSRLTGAGWGGCVISLVPSEAVNTFLQTVKEEYYSNVPVSKTLRTEEYIFATTPGNGAALLLV